MPTAKTKSKKSLFGEGKVTINKNMRDYSKSPFFVKKNKEAAEFMKKIGLPKELRK